MGAWALRLFCCDWDLDLVQDLDKVCGLPALEVAAGRQPRPGGDLTGAARRDERDRIEAGKSGKILPINYSMFEKLCSDPAKIRAHLDDTDTLARVFADFKREAVTVQRSYLRDPYGPGYKMCILGACAMTLGARLSPKDRSAMKKYYRTCGLMRDAVTQIEEALEPNTGYADGRPWDFGNIGCEETSKAILPPQEDQLFPGLLMRNVWSPDHGRQNGEKLLQQKTVSHLIAYRKPGVEDLAQILASLMFDPYETARTQISSTKADSHPAKYRAEAERMVRLYDFNTRPDTKAEHSDRTCEACEGGGGKLLKCGKCQEVLYCNRSCQKKDFPKHKVMCPLLTRLKQTSEVDPMEERATFSKGVPDAGWVR